MRSLFQFTAVSVPILTVVALLSSSTANLRAIELSPLPILRELTTGTLFSGEQEQVDAQPLVWVQLEQDGSHLTLAEALKLPPETLLHFNGVTRSQPLEKGSWISLPALFRSHLEDYAGPWINPSSLRLEPPEFLTPSAALAQREATIFEDRQPLIWIQLVQETSYEELAGQIKMSPDILRLINGGWTDEKPLAKDSWISVPRDWRSAVEYAISLDLLTVRETPPPGLAFYNTVPQRGERIHTVVEGEQLTTISAQGGYHLATIHALNPDLPDQDLRPGMRLKVPLAARNSQRLAARPTVAGLSWPNQELAGQQQELRFDTRWSWPILSGLITSGYGWRWGRMHNGIDISDHVGTPVLAAADGHVKRASWHHNGYGYLVELTHPDGSLTRYAHNSSILVKPGQTVRRGQVISLLGCTGLCTGSHLHFEIHPTGRGAADPLALLPER